MCMAWHIHTVHGIHTAGMVYIQYMVWYMLWCTYSIWYGIICYGVHIVYGMVYVMVYMIWYMHYSTMQPQVQNTRSYTCMHLHALVSVSCNHSHVVAGFVHACNYMHMQLQLARVYMRVSLNLWLHGIGMLLINLLLHVHCTCRLANHHVLLILTDSHQLLTDHQLQTTSFWCQPTAQAPTGEFFVTWLSQHCHMV